MMHTYDDLNMIKSRQTYTNVYDSSILQLGRSKQSWGGILIMWVFMVGVVLPNSLSSVAPVWMLENVFGWKPGFQSKSLVNQEYLQ